MKKFNNETNIDLSFAVYLATDDYDHNEDPTHISATTLIKPLKKVILGSRVDTTYLLPDISTRIKSNMGSAIHNAIEQAWLTNYKQAMSDLGYPESVINRVAINPSSEELNELREQGNSPIPVYMEQRRTREIDGMKISGKYDFVLDGNLEDFKTTSTYTYIEKTNDKDYVLQGSIYRWLNPDIITGDQITIQYQFTDWSPLGLKRDPRRYPPKMQMAYKLNLMSIPETENYVRSKIQQLKKYWNAKEEDIPECTPTDLWQKPSVWKYYKDPNKTSRSTANFNDMGSAYARLQKDGNVGIVKEFKSPARACMYCNGFSICKQKDKYI